MPTETTPLLVRFTPYEKADLEVYCAANCFNQGELVRRAVREFLAARKATCCQCGKHAWIAGYTHGQPLCDECM